MAAKFKVGDRVLATADAAEGEIGTIARDDGISPRYLVKFDNWTDGHGNDGREWWLDTAELEPAPPTIVAGRYYKTRDGRRIGPMVRISDGGNAEYYWSAPMGQLGSYGSYWCKEGAYYKDGDQHDNDIIAEWPDEPARPYRTSIAAQVDTIADEYGAAAKPKFKVGDRVVYDGKTAILREHRGSQCYIPYLIEFEQDVGYGHNGNDVGAVRLTSGRGWWVRNIELAEPTPAIVALIENGQPLPAKRPYVHPNRASAVAESKRLAGKHPGKEFGVYEFVSSAKEAKTYAHEWQRLAASGRKIDAIRELRVMSGLGLATAKRAVEDWLIWEAA